MLKVSIHNAKLGMELALPIFHPTLPGHMLLRPGFVMDEPALTRLRELRVRELWVRVPQLETLVGFFNAEVVEEQAHLARLMGSAFDQVREPMFGEVDFRHYAASIKTIIEKLSREPKAAILVGDVVGAERPFVMHAMATCFISLLMGIKLESYLVEQRRRLQPTRARSVENLGIGALLCDVGMLKLPHEVVERWKQTGDEQDPAFREHVKLGFQMLRGKVEPTAAAAVLQHHQRYDGFGWPAARTLEGPAKPGQPTGLMGEQIHVFARIIAVADRFDRLRNPPSADGREEARQPTVRCLKQMLTDARKRVIDPTVFKALVGVVPAYSPGTIVELNDTRAAVVAEFDPLNPCRPLVRTVHLRDGKLRLDDNTFGEWIDLKRRRDLWVSRAEDIDVSADNFEPDHPMEFDLHGIQPTGRYAGLAA